MAQCPIPSQATSSAPTLHPHPISVIGAHYCLPYPVDLTIVRKAMSLTIGCFTVTDVNDNIMFKVKQHFSFHDKRTMFDSNANPLATVTEKVFSAREQHFVFRENSTDPKDLLFTVRRSSFRQLNTTLHIYLASNTSQDVCDFKIKGDYVQRSCAVYAGESDTIIAQMHKKTTAASIFLNKDRFNVTINPNVDTAFIVALIVVLDDINGDGYG